MTTKRLRAALRETAPSTKVSRDLVFELRDRIGVLEHNIKELRERVADINGAIADATCTIDDLLEEALSGEGGAHGGA